MVKRNQDDRRDNVDKIQENINHTQENFRLAEEMIEQTSNPKMKEDLKEKNHRRRDALNSMKTEIRDEAIDKAHGYKN